MLKGAVAWDSHGSYGKLKVKVLPVPDSYDLPTILGPVPCTQAVQTEGMGYRVRDTALLYKRVNA
jgi:hypothetical protein